MKKDKLISVLIPLYNEEESINKLYSELLIVLEKYNYEVIFINDGSTDNSIQIIKEIINKNKNNIYLIDLYKNYGKSAALSEGFKHCKGDFIVTLDADLQDDPEEIHKLYEVISKEGFDLVSGWKKKRNDPPVKLDKNALGYDLTVDLIN